MTPELPTFTIQAARALLRPRPADGHKGTFGTAMLVCGSHTIGGCAILAAKACLRSGVGKVVVHVPESLRQIVMSGVPEAIVSLDENAQAGFFTKSPKGSYKAIGVGPGLGLADATAKALENLFVEHSLIPHVVDADAIRLLPNLSDTSIIPEKAILTPHLGELSCLVGEPVNDPDRLNVARLLARNLHRVIIAKGHPTYVIDTDGSVNENTTGSDAIATAGSGDVLTGIITALLAQGYAPYDAAKLGTFLHGLAGDMAATHLGHHSVIASDIINHLPQAFLSLQQF